MEIGQDLKSEDLGSLTFLSLSYLICKMGITLFITTILRIKLEYECEQSNANVLIGSHKMLHKK